MKHFIDEPTIQNYLSALESRMGNMPPEQAEEILFGVREHIIDALTRDGSSVKKVLSQLGNPDDVLAEMAGTQAPDITKAPHRSSRLWIFMTAGLLTFGGFIFGIGWFAGVAGLWMGTRWKLWEKVIGTALLPGGVFGGLVLSRLIFWPMAPSTNGGSEPVIPGLPPGATAILLCIPVLISAYLVVTGFRRPCAHLSATSASIRHN